MAALDIAKLFRDEAEELRKARDKCIQIHGTDIRAAGNEVEMAVRGFFQRMLPKRFSVTQGHLIDRNGKVSPQIDVIVADNTTLPSLLTTADGTEYIPIDSVYAVGEIKSTFYRSQKYMSAFSETLRSLREDMVRPLVENTIHYGFKDTTIMRDVFLGKPHEYLNPLFSFMVFINHGDMTEDSIEEELRRCQDHDLPGMTVILDMSAVFFGRRDGQKFTFEKYPSLARSKENAWFISPLAGVTGGGSMEGNHLGMAYYSLLEHLNQSFLEPPDLRPYFADMLVGRISTSREIRKP